MSSSRHMGTANKWLFGGGAARWINNMETCSGAWSESGLRGSAACVVREVIRQENRVLAGRLE